MVIVPTRSWMLIYVRTQYRHICTASQQHFISQHVRSALRRRRVSAPRRSRSYWAASFLSSVFSTNRPPRRGKPRPNCHSHWFTSYTLLPRQLQRCCPPPPGPQMKQSSDVIDRVTAAAIAVRFCFHTWNCDSDKFPRSLRTWNK